MIRKIMTLSVMMAVTMPVLAAVQCGPFHLVKHQDGTLYVNEARPKTQKVTFTGKQGDYDNVKYHLVVKNTKAPGMLAMDNLYQNGKATLNVEVVRTSASQIRLSGSYDCDKAD